MSCQLIFFIFFWIKLKCILSNSVICKYFELEQWLFSAVRLKIVCPRDRGSSCVKVSVYCYVFRISINDIKSVEMTSITYLSKQVEKQNKQCGGRESIRIVCVAACLSWR